MRDSKTQPEVASNRLAMNTMWMLLGHLSRLVIHGAYIILLARVLGVEKLGAFSAVIAVVMILASFSGLGRGSLLVMHVARDIRAFSKCWGNGLVVIFVVGSLLSVGTLIFGKLILTKIDSLHAVFLFALSELIFARVLELSALAFQAIQRLHLTAMLNTLLSLVRLVAVVCFASFSHSASIENWAYWYLAASFVAGLTGYFVVIRLLGKPELSLKSIFNESKLGFFFSLSFASKAVYTNIDKVMLAELGTLEATGIYSVAYRIVTVAFAPVHSLLSATLARFFQAGLQGIKGTLHISMRLMPFAVGYGLIAGVILYCVAPLLTIVLGSEYSESVNALKWLAVVPLLQTIHYLLADTLTGAGFQGFRSVAQITVAATNVILNFWLIPLYSWKGAIWSTITCEVLLTALLGGIVVSRIKLHHNVVVEAVNN